MVAVRAALIIAVLAFSFSYVADADAQETCELNPYQPHCEFDQKEGNALVQRGASKWGPPAPPPGGCPCETQAVGQCHCSNPPFLPSSWCPVGKMCVGNCCQDASIANAVKAGGAAPPNPFYKPTGISVADTMLGFNMPDKSQCGDFLSKMMDTLKNSGGSLFGSSSDPQAAVQQLMADLFKANGADYSKSFGCLKYALVYGDKHYIPEECVTAEGELDPSCCVHEKRCSTTNPADGCPWSTFGVNAPSVTCVGSHEISPVAMGVCKCKQPGARCGFQGQGCLAPGA